MTSHMASAPEEDREPALRPGPPLAALLRPVDERERLAPVDVLRGVALLGILAMNIIAFALPFTAYMNPTDPSVAPYAGPFEGLNFAAWLVNTALFDSKMITLFSMLFGAGLVLMGGRAAERSGDGRGRFAAVYYRRLLWLLAIGLVHALAIWYGDILVSYALAGLVLYPMRNLRTRTLLFVGVALVVIGLAIPVLMGLGLAHQAEEAPRLRQILDAGGTLDAGQARALEQWDEFNAMMRPSAESVAETVESFRSPPPAVFAANARAWSHVVGFMFLGLPRLVGIMLIGMALMKAGAFAAACSPAFYGRLMIAGYGLGLPLVLYGAYDLVSTRFEPIHMITIGFQYNGVGSLLVALGHVGLVMLIVRSGALAWLTARLAAAGRMALTNYLAQSLICTFLFYGWGLGLYGRLERGPLYLVVVGVWILQLAWSPWWLSRFRFGPAEWLWRSLTYWRRQPMRRRAPAPPGPAVPA